MDPDNKYYDQLGYIGNHTHVNTYTNEDDSDARIIEKTHERQIQSLTKRVEMLEKQNTVLLKRLEHCDIKTNTSNNQYSIRG